MLVVIIKLIILTDYLSSKVIVTIDMLRKQGYSYPPLKKQSFSYKYDVDLHQIPKDMLFVSYIVVFFPLAFSNFFSFL